MANRAPEIRKADWGAVAYVVPFCALLLVPAALGGFGPESSPADASNTTHDGLPLWIASLQVVLCGGLLYWFWPVYQRAFPLRFSLWGPVVGGIGFVIWIALCFPEWERSWADAWGLGGILPARSAVNPFEKYKGSELMLFLVLRFLVLAGIVPLVEELFVRGWLVRWLTAAENWEDVSLKRVNGWALIGVLGYAVLTHPQEALAAIAWFGLVNWLMCRTGNLWDCVLAHATTNLALGFWILSTGDWRLW